MGIAGHADERRRHGGVHRLEREQAGQPLLSSLRRSVNQGSNGRVQLCAGGWTYAVEHTSRRQGRQFIPVWDNAPGKGVRLSKSERQRRDASKWRSDTGRWPSMKIRCFSHGVAGLV